MVEETFIVIFYPERNSKGVVRYRASYDTGRYYRESVEKMNYTLKHKEYEEILLDSKFPNTMKKLDERFEMMFKTNLIELVGDEEFNEILGDFEQVTKEEFALLEDWLKNG